MSSAKSAPKKQVFKGLSDIDHVLLRSGMYIGSIDTITDNLWIYDSIAKHMTWKKVLYNPGLYKIADEIIANAYDEFKRSQVDKTRSPVKSIDVSVTPSPLTIRVTNHGESIPIEVDEESGKMIPELVFGNLRTSSNYDDSDEREWNGTNGIGSKATNIYSNRFTVELMNPKFGKSYKQTWTGNMKTCGKAEIKKSASSKGSVSIEFEPDLSRFCKDTGGKPSDEFIQDFISILHTRTIQLAALVGSSVKVSWNDTAVGVNNFEKFTKLFLKDGLSGSSIAYEHAGDRWEVAAVLTRQLYGEDGDSPDARYIAFVNGSPTFKGGKHVDYVTKQILGDLCEIAAKKKMDVKPGQVKDSIVFFINCTIINPAYSSQTKEELTTPVTKFGSKPVFGGKLVEGLVKLGILDEIAAINEAKLLKDAKKTDGKKRSTVRGLPKLEDAHWAGTAKSKECTLILTEGDSAATSAISGLSIVGRDAWGVFPLKGKLLNVKDISLKKFTDNEELTAIKRILGLEHGKVYKSLSELRYGRIMIMADQDHDGSHIKGLVMNLFHTEWPTLLKEGFVCTLKTPLLKATKGNEVISFYSQPEYNAWREGRDLRGWHVKYYKGLGTSTPEEAKEWFEELREIKYEWDATADDSISLAFNKKRADDRKKWLSHYDPTKMLEEKGGKASYSSFVHSELIHFSNADNIRSLPHLMDGLKPSQRKILYGCLKRHLKAQVKVAQLAGYVSEHAAYHHGEASLNSTIVGMAQNFVGANNINLLKPIGQFGSRLQGGSDSASPRYIFTCLEDIVDKIFRKEDNILLKHIEDDGDVVEPEYYLPVVPLLAMNGSLGIGTGYSTNIPPHKPEDIVSLLKHRLSGSIPDLSMRALDPWWFGFKGKVQRQDAHTWITKGIYEFDEAKKDIIVSELPVGTWSKDYKEFLEKLVTMEGGNPYGLKDYLADYDDVRLRFVLHMTEDGFYNAQDNVTEFERNFKLTSSWKTTNMHCFDTDFNIKQYDTVGDIMEEFVEHRLPMYEARRQKMLEVLRKEITELEAKVAFIQAYLDGRIELRMKSDEEIVENLKTCGIPALSGDMNMDDIDSYEYVMKMRIDRQKASAIEAMNREVDNKKHEIDVLERETPSSMWLKDLDEFETAYAEFTVARVAYMTGTKSKKKVAPGAKKAVSGGVKRKIIIKE